MDNDAVYIHEKFSIEARKEDGNSYEGNVG